MKTGNQKIDIKDYSRKWIKESQKEISFELILAEIRKEQVLVSLNKYKHENILEIGSGLMPIFPYCNYKQYVVVEPSKEFVDYNKKLAKKRKNIFIIQGYIEDVWERLKRFARFDFIIASSLIHEVPSPRRFLKSILRICNPETVVHINCPNIYSFHRLLAYEMGLIEDISEKSKTDMIFQRHSHFDMKSLFRIVQEEGFSILDYGTYFIKPFSNEQMERIIANNIVPKEIIRGLQGMTKYMPDMGCEMFVNIKIKENK